jgi:hypothetical protein
MKSPVKFVCNVVVPTLVALTSIAVDANEWIPYSYNGVIETSELSTIEHLAWPQSGAAIIGRIGSPSYRSSTADWYLRPGGMGRLRIDYDQNTNVAIGYQLEGN